MRIAGILLAAQQAAVHAGANHTTYSTTSHGIAGLTLLESTHGLSVDEIRSLKLDSEDLRGLGVSSAADRLAILRAAASEPDSPAATPTLRNPNATALQDFTFVVSHFNSTRQYGKCLNIIVKYRYVPGALPNATGGGYLDYRDMRDTAMQFAQPTADLPMAVQWEEITMRFNEEVLEKYENSIVALSTQIQVCSCLRLSPGTMLPPPRPATATALYCT